MSFDASPIPALIVAAAGLALAGLALLLAGLRGRRVDDHPVCRRCGFDLFNRPPDSTRCAECGADLNRRRALRVGNRRRRRGLVATGLAVLVPALVVLAGGAREASRGVDWQRHKPAWWIEREAFGPDAADPKVRDAALAELLRRARAGGLSAGRARSAADKALGVQGDPRRPWLTEYGDLIEAARDAGHLTAEQWRRYARQAAAFESKVPRRRVRRGDSAYITARLLPPRLGQRARFHYDYRRGDVRIGGRVASDGGGGVIGSPLRADRYSGHYTTQVVTDRPAVGDLPDGPQTISMEFELKVYDGDPPEFINGRRPQPEPLVAERREASGKFTLVPASEPLVRLRSDPPLRRTLAKASSAWWQVRPEDPPTLWLRVSVRPVAVALACRVFVRERRRDGEERAREWPVGALILPAGDSGGETFRKPLSELAGFEPRPAEAVDVVLRPDVSLLASESGPLYEALEIEEVWSEEITIENVAPAPD